VKVGSANGTSYPVTGLSADSVHLRGGRPRRGGQRVRGLTRCDRADPAGRPDRRLVGYPANIWPGGFTATATLKNTGATAIPFRRAESDVAWSLPPH